MRNYCFNRSECIKMQCCNLILFSMCNIKELGKPTVKRINKNGWHDMCASVCLLSA